MSARKMGIDYLRTGLINKAHGVAGEVVVTALSDDHSRYRKLKKVFLETSDGYIEHEVIKVRSFGDRFLFSLKGVTDMDMAKKLQGKYLCVTRDMAVKLPEGSYFVCDLLGSIVVDETGNELGVLDDVLETGANDVYSIKDISGKLILLPAIKSVVLSVDTKVGRIVVKVPKEY